jgi:hypothetical protein
VAKNSKQPRKSNPTKRLSGTTAEGSPQEAARVPSGSGCFPIYLLRLGPSIQVVVPENREDLDHPDFWEQTVCLLVARHFGIPPRKLANLPYCQRRARIVGNKVEYGEARDPELLRLICEALGNPELVFRYDDHEKRLRENVRDFKKLVRGRRPT